MCRDTQREWSIQQVPRLSKCSLHTSHYTWNSPKKQFQYPKAFPSTWHLPHCVQRQALGLLSFRAQMSNPSLFFLKSHSTHLLTRAIPVKNSPWNRLIMILKSNTYGMAKGIRKNRQKGKYLVEKTLRKDRWNWNSLYPTVIQSNSFK